MTAHPRTPGASDPHATPSCALLTDLYELTMAAAYLGEGMADDPATFSLFVRRLPPERGYLVAAGLDDVLRHLEQLRFTDADLAALARVGLFDDELLAHLGSLRFTGSVRAVPEGRVVFADEPILEVDAPLLEAQIVETYALNQITLQTSLATAAARMRDAAGDRAVVDFALRRTQGIDAGMKLVRCGAIAGLAATSNVAGGLRYDVALSGTMAHSFVQAHPDETDAFRVFARRFGSDTILLVDTYDTPRGVDRAIEVAHELRAEGVELRGIRLDSGDLAVLARDARARLDAAGFDRMQVFASGGLDEHSIHRLVAEEEAPIDGFGVGSALGVSQSAPVLDSVYKLVEHAGRPVRKTSEAKATWPGRKQVWRPGDPDAPDVLGVEGEPGPTGAEPLLVEVLRSGERTDAGFNDLAAAHERFERDRGALPATTRQIVEPAPRRVEPSAALRALVAAADARRSEPTTGR